MIRSASAVWNGSGKEGTGTVSTESTAISNAQFSYKTRFEDGVGTNPEELVAAAHAGCFSMKLSFVLGAAGFTPETINTTCQLSFEAGVITKSHLVVSASVPGISKEQFDAAVAEAEANCPISVLLKTPIGSISSEATLA